MSQTSDADFSPLFASTVQQERSGVETTGSIDPAGTTADQGPVQILAPDGTRLRSEAYDDRIDALTADELRGFYRDMALVRRFDQEATALQRQGELALWASCLGQEAAQIGSGRALAPRDFVFPSYREHGVAHTRGLDLPELLHLFRGQEHGGWDPSDTNFHLYTMVIGSHPLHATGYAQGVQRDGLVGSDDPDRDMGVIAYFGDGATSEGDVSEAMVFAAAAKAPIVFFCQNNQWAISAPTSVQTSIPLYRRGEGFGIPSIQVDGNDVLACYAVTLEAIERARRGDGPTFIEAYTYRMGAHTTSDDPTRYRSRDEEESWQAKDPIARLRTYLESMFLADEDFFDAVEASADALGERTRDACRAMTPHPAISMFDNIYAEPNSQVEEERAWFVEYQRAMSGEEETR